ERDVGRLVDDAHPAPAGETLDPVSGEHRPGLKRIGHGAILRGAAVDQGPAPGATRPARPERACSKAAGVTSVEYMEGNSERVILTASAWCPLRVARAAYSKSSRPSRIRLSRIDSIGMSWVPPILA